MTGTSMVGYLNNDIEMLLLISVRISPNTVNMAKYSFVYSRVFVYSSSSK